MNIEKIHDNSVILNPGKVVSIAPPERNWHNRFVLVRHAEKGPGFNPQLTAKGKKRAQLLCEILGPISIDHIFCTDSIRVLETASPLSAQRQIPVQTYSSFTQHQYFLYFNQSHVKTTNLVVGHQNTIPALVNSFLPKPQFDTLENDNFGTLFLLFLYEDATAFVYTFSY